DQDRPASAHDSTSVPLHHRLHATISEPREQSTGSASISERQPKTDQKGVTYTALEGNAFVLEFRKTGTRVLVDPWLIGPLDFGGGSHLLYQGTKRALRFTEASAIELARSCDLILITQSINDHCHKPTLAVLPRDIPVVAAPGAATIVQGMGYTSVQACDHGQSVEAAGGRLSIKASQGALTGPPWAKRQNGYRLVENTEQGARVYYEPHADFVQDSVSELGKVDVVITPPTTISLVGYRVVHGGSPQNLKLLTMLAPDAVIALKNADFEEKGPLAGDVATMRVDMAKIGALADTQLYEPEPGQPIHVML
ncbi:hypothetical protein APUTEX25_000650, partial [Auxenochlorella protothecoides]